MKMRLGHEEASIPGIKLMSVKGNLRSIVSPWEVISQCYPMSVSSYLLHIYMLRMWGSEGIGKAEGDTARPQF